MARVFGVLMILVLLFACESEKKTSVDISDIEINITIDRFEEKFYTATDIQLSELKKEYPYMFPSQVADSIWIAKINDENEQYLFEESQNIFGDINEQKQELEDLFKHLKYYNPRFIAPTVITHISDLDYEYPIIYADSLLFISLDMYLGKDNIVYKDFPVYIADNFEKNNVVVDVAKEIIIQTHQKFRNRTFLDRMINEGKYMYLLDSYLPETSDVLKIGYSAKKMGWAETNEIDIWKYFIEHELLYSSDATLNSRFIDVAPFSKFYQQADQDSPGRIGIWIGWQIVRSYMKNNDVTLLQLMADAPEEVLKKSKYKPRK